MASTAVTPAGNDTDANGAAPLTEYQTPPVPVTSVA